MRPTVFILYTIESHEYEMVMRQEKKVKKGEETRNSWKNINKNEIGMMMVGYDG